MIRSVFIVIFVLLIAILMLCGIASWRSEKTIGRSVGLFCFSLIPPVLGNMIIVGATTENMASVGCYIYYIGMNLVMYTLINFTNKYCIRQNDTDKKAGIVPDWIKYILVIDAVQVFMNIVFKHAFVLQEIEAYGKPYFIMEALPGQIVHRVVCYGAMAMIMIVFIIRSIQASRLHRERYIHQHDDRNFLADILYLFQDSDRQIYDRICCIRISDILFFNPLQTASLAGQHACGYCK